MLIPYQDIDADTLNNLLEYHVLREGTDYGETEMPLEQQVAQLKAQLQSGELVLVYSELHESVNLMAARDFKAAEAAGYREMPDSWEA